MVKYNIGDIVKFKSVREHMTSWSYPGMTKFLGMVVKIRYTDGWEITFDGSESWGFTITDIERMATEEEIRVYEEEEKAGEELAKELSKHLVYELEDVRNIAEDVFGKDRVDVTRHSNQQYDVIIHFPEIVITNSLVQRHTIKDLFVKLTVDHINPLSDAFKCSINIEGMRTTLSVKEVHSRYQHSHLPRGYGFNNFCLGGSQSNFYMVVTNLRMSLSRDDWYILFLSLEPFVSWESIEGGPHLRMSDIKWRGEVSPSVIEKECLSILPMMTPDMFEYSSSLRVRENHPLLYQLFNTHSKIRNLNGGVSKEQIKLECQATINELDGLKFKNKKIKIVMYEEDEPTENNNISKEVVDKYIQIINARTKTFNKQYNYEQLKSNSKIREDRIITISDSCNNKKAEKADRLPA